MSRCTKAIWAGNCCVKTTRKADPVDSWPLLMGIDRSDPITWCPGPSPWPSLLTLHGQSRPGLHAISYTQLGVFKNLGHSACTGPVLSASLGVGLRPQEFFKLSMWFHSAVPAQNSAPGSLQTLGRRAEGSLAQHCALGVQWLSSTSEDSLPSPLT